MKNNKHKTNWYLDVILLLLFLILFFMDITGVALHQWLGVGLGLLIMIHLINHWDWVECIISRFFGKTSNKARLYAVIDALLLLGLVMIIESGLVISTWFNLTWIDYATWWEIHIYSAISTLVLTVIKIALHRTWIINTTRKIFARQAVSPAPLVPAGATAVSRRQFLAAMGLISLGSALAISNVLPRRSSAQATTAIATEEDLQIAQAAAAVQSEPTATQAAATATQLEPTQTTTVSTEAPTQVVEPTATAVPTEVPTVAPTATTAAVASSSSLVCTRSCRKRRHCSYPGDCRDYTDQNGNGLCDLGECA